MSFRIRICNDGDDMFIATWSGDPGRTYCEESARHYKTKESAQRAVRTINGKYDWRKMNLKVEEVI